MWVFCVQAYFNSLTTYCNQMFSTEQQPENTDQVLLIETVKNLRSTKDFASKNSGATILKSSKGISKASNILSKSNDEYLLVADCDPSTEELVIHLSEEVSVDHILADNYEDFSANFDHIEFFGSSEFPPKNNKWKLIGSIEPTNDLNFHLAELTETYKQDKSMIRYLKVTMKGKEGNQLYCTLTHL